METWFWVLSWALSVLTITGNGFIISLVGRNRPLRTKTNAFIASLAVADFLVGVGVVPSLFFCEISGGGCKWSRAWSSWLPDLIRWLFGYASAFNLCSLVTDRYIAIVKPLKYVTCVTPRRVIQMIFLSWAIPFGFVTTTFFLVLFRIEYADFINASTMFFEVASCCIVIFCYCSMVLAVYKHDRSAAALAKQLRFNHKGLTFNKHDKSAFTMTTIVVVLFLICYGIHCRCGFVSLFLSLPCNDFEYKLPILVSNSAINPWAYAFFKRDIKKETRKLICRAASKNDNKVVPISKANHVTVGTCSSTL